MCVCVHGGLHCRRKAGASKWTESGPWAAPVCSFVVPKMGPKTGPKNGGCNIAGRRKGFQNGGPVSGTRVLHTPSAPLCVQWVAETPEPFVCFPCNGLDKASSTFHTHNIYIYIFFFSRSTPLFQPGLCHLRRDGEGLHQTQYPPGDRWTQSAANHRRAASDGAAKLPMRLGGGNGHGVIGQCLIFHNLALGITCLTRK